MEPESPILSFFNPENPPVPGGWRYWLDPTTRLLPIQGSSAGEIFDQIKSYQLNNARFISDSAIWREIWRYWCAQEPSRCVSMPSNGVVGVAEVPKEVWGPILWNMLSWSASNFSQPFFLALIDEMRDRLITCATCQEHFVALLTANPPTAVTTRQQACVYVWKLHNSVNSIAGKPLYAYETGMQQFGWPSR